MALNLRRLQLPKRFSTVYSSGVHSKELGGKQLIMDSSTNQGMAFDITTRQTLNMQGLLPPRVMTQQEQIQLCWNAFHKCESNIEKYNWLSDLSNRNEKLFYAMLQSDLKQLVPIVYTPTVGEACQNYGDIFRMPRGMWITINDKGYIREVLKNWPEKSIRAIVVTDGERILGLGDLGAHGMGIPVGKLALYTACAGLEPSVCLPICLDVGTDNPRLLEDPYYIGVREKRCRGLEYEEFIDEFMEAVKEVFGRLTLIQFEDFANQNAFKFLKRYKNRFLCFNDDIQGTAACAVAGLLGASRITGQSMADQKFLFLGSGSAGMGIAQLIRMQLKALKVPNHIINEKINFFDAEGLICADRIGYFDPDHETYAHDIPHTTDFAEAVRQVRPTAIIGVAGAGPIFTQEVLEEMAKINDRPIVFALSNPTSKAECTAVDAYKHTNGRCVYATGSPQYPVEITEGEFAGVTMHPGQGNNIYIFPGVAMSAVLSGARHIPEKTFLIAANTVAESVSQKELDRGQIFPDLERIQEVSDDVAANIMDYIYSSPPGDCLASFMPEPQDKKEYVKQHRYQTGYAKLTPEMWYYPGETDRSLNKARSFSKVRR